MNTVHDRDRQSPRNQKKEFDSRDDGGYEGTKPSIRSPFGGNIRATKPTAANLQRRGYEKEKRSDAIRLLR